MDYYIVTGETKELQKIPGVQLNFENYKQTNEYALGVASERIVDKYNLLPTEEERNANRLLPNPEGHTYVLLLEWGEIQVRNYISQNDISNTCVLEIKDGEIASIDENGAYHRLPTHIINLED